MKRSWMEHSEMIQFLLSSLYVIVVNIIYTPNALAKPKGCSPSDPTGRNRTADLCLKYPPFGLNPYGSSFTDSFDHRGFYGPRVTPIKRGIDLKPRKQDGFFSGVKAKNNMTIIQSSSGRQWRGSVTPQKIRLK